MPARQASDKSQCCSLPLSASAWGGGQIGRPQMNEIHQSLKLAFKSFSPRLEEVLVTHYG